MGRWLVFLLVAFLIGTGGIAGAAFISSGSTTEPVFIRQGVSPLVVDGVALIAVRDGDDVVVFLAGDRRRDVLEWCEPSQVFTTLAGGSIFDLDGRKLEGPSPADLDRVRVSPSDQPDRFLVDPGQIITPESDPGISDPWVPRLDAENWPVRFETSPAAYCPRPEDIPARR